MKRRELREHAFKLIFSECEGGLEYYLSDNGIKGKDALALTQKTQVVLENLEAIDEVIEKHIKGYTFDRISKVSLAVMRLAVSEILFDNEVPDGVAISEAMEIVATYEDEKSKAFVNGVLGAVSRGK